MTAARLFDLAGTIAMIAFATTILIRGSAAAQVITAIGNAFSGSLQAAVRG